MIKLSLLIFLGTLSCWGFIREPGETGYVIQKIPFSAQARALGDAGVARSNDGAYATLNPSGLAKISQDMVYLSHINFFHEMRSEYLNTSMHYGKIHLGITLEYFDYGSGYVTTDGSDYDETNTFRAYDITGILTGAYSHGPFDFGVNLKGIRGRLWNHSSHAFSVDLGATYHSKIKGAQFGASLLNLGFTTPFLEETFPLTQIFRLGGAYQFSLSQTVKAEALADLNASNDGQVTLPAGLSVGWESFVLRGGYHLLHHTRGVSLGAGWAFSNLGLDYCFIHYKEDLNTNGRPHYFALTLFF